MTVQQQAWQRQILFWIAALAAFIALVGLLHGMLLPFVAGLALAYLLDPVANRIESLGVNRAMATFAMILVLAIVLVVLVIALAPVLFNQASELVDNLPGYIARLQELVNGQAKPWVDKLSGSGLPNVNVGEFVKNASSAALVFFSSLWSGGQALVSVVSLLVITPVVAFYLLIDWKRIVRTVDDLLPRDHAGTIRGLLREIDAAIAGFVRGQTSICVILAAFYMIAFALAGLRFGFFIGLAAGIATFVPYVGSFIGLFVATGVAALQFWPEWTPIIIVLCIGVVGQVLESYVLSPYLVGTSVGLHPVWLMFALFAFGYLFGFVGLIVAIPLSAAVAVLVRFALRQYRDSRMYLGEGQP
jgi:predicted PurR-regulated permease PerM